MGGTLLEPADERGQAGDADPAVIFPCFNALLVPDLGPPPRPRRREDAVHVRLRVATESSPPAARGERCTYKHTTPLSELLRRAHACDRDSRLSQTCTSR